MNPSEEIEELCKKLKPIIGSNAEKLWYMYLSEDFIGRRDIALDIELVAEKLLKDKALDRQEILLSPPSNEESHGSFLLGNVAYNKKKLQPLYLKPEDFIKQIGIFAVTGEGKTNLAYLLALQLLKSKIPFIVIDWKRSWRSLLSLQDRIPELKDIKVYTIGRKVLPFAWNPFRPPPGADKQLWISTIAESLEKSHLSGPGVAYYFNKIYLNLFKYLKNGDFYPNFHDGLRELNKIRAWERELKWKQTALRIFQSFTIGCASKAFNSRNPIKLEQLLDKPVIFELDLEMPKPLRIFFSEIILKWIHLYRLSQGETENLRHVMFLEEVHNLFTESAFYKESNSIENVYREVRAFGQGLVSITQHPCLLPIYLLGNCHTQIYLGLQHADDIRTARKALFLNPDQEAYLNMLRVGEAIVKIKNRIEPCLVKIPLVPVKKGFISDDWLINNISTYLPLLHDGKEHKKPGYLPPDIYSNVGQGKKGLNHKNNRPPQFKLLLDVFQYALSTITQRYKRLTLNPKYGNKYKNLLVTEGYLKPRSIITSKGRTLLFDLTHKARMTLRDMGHEVKNLKEGIVHQFWKQKIAEYYKKKGLEVLIEEDINGRPDIIVIDGKKRIAFEIETGKSNAIGNIQRNLRAGFDEVICVATDKKAEDIIRKELRKINFFNKIIEIMCAMKMDIII